MRVKLDQEGQNETDGGNHTIMGCQRGGGGEKEEDSCSVPNPSEPITQRLHLKHILPYYTVGEKRYVNQVLHSIY